jgi:CRISPR system Cascade subunit CasE
MNLTRAEIPWPVAANPYELHRRIWRLFPDEPGESRRDADGQRTGFLFRVEENRPGQPARALVQSRRTPQAAEGIRLIATRTLDPRPSAGQRLAFLLTANPIRNIKDEQREQKPGKRRDSCRVPLIREEEQRDWLARKLDGSAQIEAVSVLPHQPTFFRRGNRAGKLVTVTFEGVLQVKDPSALVNLLLNGIGPAKAFGCGLMLVRRLDAIV